MKIMPTFIKRHWCSHMNIKNSKYQCGLYWCVEYWWHTVECADLWISIKVTEPKATRRSAQCCGFTRWFEFHNNRLVQATWENMVNSLFSIEKNTIMQIALNTSYIHYAVLIEHLWWNRKKKLQKSFIKFAKVQSGMKPLFRYQL